MQQSNPFDEDYFLRGPETGKSNYVNYTWMPERTIAFAERLISHWGANQGDTALDFGCSRGYVVRALRMKGILAYGYDISMWAIENADEMAKPFVSNGPIHYTSFDYVLAKDVLEHVAAHDIDDALDRLIGLVRKKLTIIVPLQARDSVRYVRDEDNKDATHAICWPLEQWLYNVSSALPDGAHATASWDIPGLKPTSRKPFQSCGFIEVVKAMK